MHFCYIDDSGRDGVTTLTGLLIPAHAWGALLDCWLEGRRQLTATWGVGKNVELHANEFARGKTEEKYCTEAPEQEDTFKNRGIRGRAYDILLKQLSGCDELIVTTMVGRTTKTADLYKQFIEHLDAWAVDNDTYVVVVLDGLEAPIDTTGMPADEVATAREAAVRNPIHYRTVHRELDIKARRVLEDPIIHASKYSQLVQAADLVAYATYHHLWQVTELWPKDTRKGKLPRENLVKSYQRLKDRWLPLDNPYADGVLWADVPTNEETPG